MKEKEGSSQRARKWVMTMQGSYHKAEIVAWASEKSGMTYLKIAQEIGEGGQPHLQGYFEVPNKVSLAGVKKLWQKPGFVPPHFEIAWHPVEAQSYIGNLEFVHANGEKKTGEVQWVLEFGCYSPDKGEARRQGKSWNDSLLEVKKMIDEGKSLYSLYQSHFIQMVYCGKAIASYKELVEIRKRFPELAENDITSEEATAIIEKAVTERPTQFDVTQGTGSYGR